MAEGIDQVYADLEDNDDRDDVARFVVEYGLIPNGDARRQAIVERGSRGSSGWAATCREWLSDD